MEILLTTIAPYKKRELKSDEEEEYVENLCDALCSMLLQPENQALFIKSEGFELMLITIKYAFTTPCPDVSPLFPEQRSSYGEARLK